MYAYLHYEIEVRTNEIRNSPSQERVSSPIEVFDSPSDTTDATLRKASDRSSYRVSFTTFITSEELEGGSENVEDSDDEGTECDRSERVGRGTLE